MTMTIDAPTGIAEEHGSNWTLYNGDCIDVMRGLPSDSVGYSVFSPPFASLYTYSNSDRDLGNCNGVADFMEHFGFVLAELFRIMMPGRSISMHCMDLPTSKIRDGVIGLHDFPGDLIRAAEAAGFVYHSNAAFPPDDTPQLIEVDGTVVLVARSPNVWVWKDPVTAMQRTKALGLLHKTIRKDSAMSRMGIADRVVTMRKPGDNPRPIAHADDYPVDRWQKIASPIWMDINPSDTLQFRAARDENDERHIAPLQLEVIRRSVELWSAPGDIVLSPFAGIGSEVYVAFDMGRKGVGVELKPSYFEQAVRNMSHLETRQGRLFREEPAS